MKLISPNEVFRYRLFPMPIPPKDKEGKDNVEDEGLKKALTKWESVKTATLIYRRVRPEVYGDWPFVYNQIRMDEKVRVEKQRAEFVEDKDHLCHQEVYVSREYYKANLEFTHTILDACLVGSENLPGFASGECENEDKKQYLIQTLIMSGLGQRAVNGAFASASLSDEESLP